MKNQGRYLPKVVLLGRKNSGKSTLLNALYGKRRSITAEMPGQTRDILEVEVERDGLHFCIVDMPGLDMDPEEPLGKKIIDRSLEYLKKANLVFLMLSVPAPRHEDYFFLDLMRKKEYSSKPVIFVVNKADNPSQDSQILPEFYQIGLTHCIPVSALGRRNLKLLLQKAVELLPSLKAPARTTEETSKGNNITNEQLAVKTSKMPSIVPPKILISPKNQEPPLEKASSTVCIALVGKTNAGKSTLFNYILRQERSLVSEIPCTTRDYVEATLEYKGKHLHLRDTAGIRRSSVLRSLDNQTDFYSFAHTKRAIQKSEIVVHLMDPLVGLTELDKKICSLAQGLKKAVLFAVSKWDSFQEDKIWKAKELKDRAYFLFPHLQKLPIVFCSGKNGEGVSSLLENCIEMSQRMKIRIPVSELNSSLKKWRELAPESGRRLKISYVTQTSEKVPSFLFFVNDESLAPSSLPLYLENCVRKQYHLAGLPIQIRIRKKR